MYAPLSKNLQILHPGYNSEFAPIVVGAIVYVLKCLLTYMIRVRFEGKEVKLLIRRIQVKSISRSFKIFETLLNFCDFKN